MSGSYFAWLADFHPKKKALKPTERSVQLPEN
jgi:hypothetical protein